MGMLESKCVLTRVQYVASDGALLRIDYECKRVAPLLYLAKLSSEPQLYEN